MRAVSHKVTPALARAVPSDGTCLLTLDPATLLPTSEVVENGLPPAGMPRLTEIEQPLSSSTGTWAALALLREAHCPHFTPREVQFVSSLAGPLADGLQRATLLRPATDSAPIDDGDTGLVLLAPDDTVEMANRAADRWLDELDGHTRFSSE